MSVYLDYNSTTPVDPRVLEAMLPYFSEKFGNAASKTHSFGWVAEVAVEQAREQVAKLINATPHEIIFTSGSTEAINLALKGTWEMYSAVSPPPGGGTGEAFPIAQKTGATKNHIITVSTEHKAVIDTCQYLESRGARVTYLPVDRQGLIDIDQLNDSITPSTLLVCVMYANNETGVIQPIAEIAKIVHAKGCILMSDVTQAIGKIPVDISAVSPPLLAPPERFAKASEGTGAGAGGSGVDILCLSSHKIYGPKGAGVLFVRRKNPRVTLSPLIHGGGHERGLRSGTLNVPALVGFGKACELAVKEMKEDANRISRLRDKLENSFLALGDVFVNGEKSARLPNVSNVSFRGIKADELIAKLPDIAVSTGSACTSAIPEPSHVLKAMGIPDEMAYASIRFSLGKFTTEKEIDFASEKIKEKLAEMRS